MQLHNQLGQREIERPGLIDAVLRRPERIVILRTAAGYGKTTLLRQIANRLGDAAWIGTLGDLQDLMLADDPDHFSEVIEAEYLLVDDYHAGDADPFQLSSLAVELTTHPPHKRLIMAGRGRPPLPIGTLGVEPGVFEVDERQMAFSQSEMTAIAEKFDATGLSEAILAKLYRKTEGWPAAVALLFSRLGGPIGAAPRIPRGDLHPYASYFEEQMAGFTPGGYSALLQYAAVLDSVEESIWTSIADSTLFGEVFDQGIRAGLPISMSRTSQEDLRLHPLFREYLYAVLSSQLSSSDLSDLHLKAGDIAADQGKHGEAILQYLSGEGYGLASTQLRMHGLHQVQQLGDINRLETVIDHSPQAVAEFPWVSTLRGYLLRLASDPERARSHINRAVSRFTEDGDIEGLAWSTAELHQLSYFDQDYADSLDHAEQMASASDLSPTALSRTYSHIAWMRCETGPIAEAELAAERGLEYSRQIQEPANARSLEHRALRTLALARVLGGRLERALELTDRLTTVPGESRFELTWTWIMRAMVVFLAGDAPTAASWLDRCEFNSQSNTVAQGEWISRWRCTIMRSLGEQPPEQLVHGGGILGRLEDSIARALLSDHRQPPRAAHPENLFESENVLIRGNALLLSGLGMTRDEPDSGLALMRRAREEFTQAGFRHHAMSVLPLEARSVAQMGDPPQAARIEAMASGWLVESGFRRFHWEIPSETPKKNLSENQILFRELETCTDPEMRERLLDALSGAPLKEGMVAHLRGRDLTWREIEVFLAYHLGIGPELADEGPWRKRVAAALYISENTLKVHVTSINRKLDLNGPIEPDSKAASAIAEFFQDHTDGSRQLGSTP